MWLFLEDGSHFAGQMLGADVQSVGEVVFSTSMTGYQEMITDPSYQGQILTLTYPIIGNYGINTHNIESLNIQVRGLVVRSYTHQPSHRNSQGNLQEYLVSNGIPAISGIDTRALVKRLRKHGVVMGLLTSNPDYKAAQDILSNTPRYDTENVISKATLTTKTYIWQGNGQEGVIEDIRKRYYQLKESACVKYRSLKVAVIDYGVKLNILRSLKARNCDVVVLPMNATVEEVISVNPDGIILSPGPGNPALVPQAANTAKSLAYKGLPILGICLGHQILARAFGAETFKLKFGHRGGNQPVKDLQTGKVYVTAHNHGYAVERNSLPSDWQITHINLNDQTVEGLEHTSLPITTIQYHCEASPGPHDCEYIFDRFLALL